MKDHPRVVIVGAGFGGLWAARALAGAPADVLVIDRNNFHTFLALLYQVAAAELSPEDIIYPVRSIIRRHRNLSFAMEEVSSIDFSARQIKTNSRLYTYDYLILSPGSLSHDFNLPGIAENAFELKTIEHAIVLRNHILSCFERALVETDTARRKQMLTFIITGGGPTGVEFTGALAELIRGPLLKDYPDLDFENEVRIILLEATGHLLMGLPERLQDYARAHLEKIGVQVRLEAAVRRVTPQEVCLADGTCIPTQTVIWTAGVRGDIPGSPGSLPQARNGQVEVSPTLQAPKYPGVYVVGDLAHFVEDGHTLPMVAPVAMQQGRWAAQNILRQINNKSPQPFHYRDPGTMVTIGRNAAVAHIKGRSFTGFFAWLMWLVVHLFRLIGFRNRLVVMLNWAWDYLFFERSVRLIIPLGHKGNRNEEGGAK